MFFEEKSSLASFTSDEIQANKKTLVYNYYNLDPEWETDQDVQRIFLIEPSIFEKYPVSQKCLDFALALSKNIPNCQLLLVSLGI